MGFPIIEVQALDLPLSLGQEEGMLSVCLAFSPGQAPVRRDNVLEAGHYCSRGFLYPETHLISPNSPAEREGTLNNTS